MQSPAPRFWWPTLVVTTTATIAVAVHHIFRLGPELIIPGIVLVAMPIALMLWARKRASMVPTALFAVLAGLIFVWFGVIDGLLDHVFKAVGLDHVTLLPGGEAELVATFYTLGDAVTSAAFYEVTGLIEAVASFAMLALTVAFVASRVAARRRARPN